MTALGVTRDGDDFVFRLFSEHAEAVDLCLFDAAGERRVALSRGEVGIWEARIRSVREGDTYGYRVHGPYQPAAGHRFAPSKLLVDPYARRVEGRIHFDGPVFGYAPDADRPDDRDSSEHVPRGVIAFPTSSESDVSEAGLFARPKTPWRDTVLYELHVKGMTKLMPDVSSELRGTYLGLASEPAIAHLRALGVTAVELLPVFECVSERKVEGRGQTNYWGYNTLSYFSPAGRYASKPENAIREFRAMVAALHRAGIEVILDVVFNHTCEGDEAGPTLSFRGIDNKSYYELAPDDPRRYVDRSGCGNTLRVEHPAVLKLVMDSLRYWVSVMGVDGFRLDLATVLGVERGRFDRGAAFFDALHQDPVLSTVKIIAEPWDVTPEGFVLGHFPAPLREWNSHFRDDVRRFWNGYEKRLGPLGDRLTGSSGVFGGRGPTASINFVTVHDGFTLRDLVSYESRHNDRNGEGNRDGAGENFSANFGVEGPTDDPLVRTARARQMRAFMATLLLAPGVPMILAGDEMGRTQRGNNNAYCLDDPTSWLPWVLDATGSELLAFTRHVVALRRELSALRPERHFRDGDITWRRPDGELMTSRDWDAPEERGLMMVMHGHKAGQHGPAHAEGASERDEASLALLVNGAAWPLDFVLPPNRELIALVDTHHPLVPPPLEALADGPGLYHLESRAVALLKFVPRRVQGST